MITPTIKRLLRAAVLCSPLPEVRLRQRALRSLTVLAYHRIGEMPDVHYPFDDALFSASEEEFARETALLPPPLGCDFAVGITARTGRDPTGWRQKRLARAPSSPHL